MNSNTESQQDQWAQITVLLEAARSHHANRDFETATKKYKQILKLNILRDEDEGSVRCELGYALYGSHNYTDAIRQSLAALEKNPSIKNIYSVHNTLGSSYFLTQQYSAAIESHKTALKMSQNENQTLSSNYQLGRSYLMDGSPDMALDIFKSCIDDLGEDDLDTKMDIQYNLGFTYAQLDKRFNSERSFRVMLAEAKRPEDSARGYFGLMQLHIGLEDYPKVIEYGKMTLEEMPDFPEQATVLQGLKDAAAKAGIDQFTKTWDS